MEEDQDSGEEDASFFSPGSSPDPFEEEPSPLGSLDELCKDLPNYVKIVSVEPRLGIIRLSFPGALATFLSACTKSPRESY